MLSAGMFFFISNAKPLEKLSAVRPHANVFSRYVIISLLVQFSLQIGLIIYMYNRASSLMEPVSHCFTRCCQNLQTMNTILMDLVIRDYVFKMESNVSGVNDPINIMIYIEHQELWGDLTYFSAKQKHDR